MKRGSTSKKNSKLVNLWVPHALLPVLDLAAEREDTDRSKFIRAAIREKISKLPAPAK